MALDLGISTAYGYAVSKGFTGTEDEFAELMLGYAEAVQQAKQSADNSESSAEDSEAWAKGTRDGSAVPSTDATYHNNAKYYAEQSDGSAEDSEAWAKGTRDGSAVPSTDPTYHNNAKYYAEQASDSATNAAGSTAQTGGPAMRTSAGRAWGRTARTTSVRLPLPGAATGFPTP